MNESKPLITVVTVTYNAGKVIGKTLKSLKNQLFEDYEFLVIDGASKDDTVARIQAAEIPQLKLVSEPDKGLYDAMNKGLRLAKGRYVIFLNAGDAFHSAETLGKYALEAAKRRDIIYGDTIIVNGEGEKIADRHLKAPVRLTRESFADGMLICHQAFMVKKDLAPQYDLRYRFSADYDWCVKCIEKGDPKEYVNLGEVTVNYLSDGLTDKNKSRSLRERYRIMNRHYGYISTFLRHLTFIVRAIKRRKI